jgi:hypothetical protein
MLKSFGSDPELMLMDENGNYVSAIGIVPGHKEDKVSLGNGHFAFYDNVLVEVNVKPSFSRDEVVKNFRDCFKKLSKLVGNFSLVPQASQIYPASECQHKDAKIFGCDPEYCLYVLDWRKKFKKLDPPQCKPGNYFRSGGGHVHIGSPLALSYGSGRQAQVLKMCEVFLGATSVLIDHDPTSLARRKIYGGAGTFRGCPTYGLEYRAMSNFWIASPKLVSLIYDLTDLLMKIVDRGRAEEIWSKIDQNELRNAINTGDRDTIMKRVFPISSTEMSKSLLDRVVEMFTPIKFNFYKEWALKSALE